MLRLVARLLNNPQDEAVKKRIASKHSYSPPTGNKKAPVSGLDGARVLLDWHSVEVNDEKAVKADGRSFARKLAHVDCASETNAAGGSPKYTRP